MIWSDIICGYINEDLLSPRIFWDKTVSSFAFNGESDGKLYISSLFLIFGS